MAYVPVAGPDGVVRVDETDLSEDELSMVGAHLNAITAFLGDEPDSPRRVKSFEGEVVAGVPLITDLDRIEELAAEGRFDIGEFYEQGPT